MIEQNKLPTLFIPHGGGPWPFAKGVFGDPKQWDVLEEHLQTIGKRFKDQINAILMISAHWEEEIPTIHFGSNPKMLYDYSGFPAHTYELQYPAPGSSTWAHRIFGILKAKGFKVGQEFDRGYDHGTFVPMMVAFPEANIPIVQLSLIHHLDASEHIRLGQALESLRTEGLLIIGSGMSYHNLRQLFDQNPLEIEAAQQFDNWLNNAVTEVDSKIRNQKLAQWQHAPGALKAHPRSEHLSPLFVVAGAAGNDLGHHSLRDQLMGYAHSGFEFT